MHLCFIIEDWYQCNSMLNILNIHAIQLLRFTQESEDSNLSPRFVNFQKDEKMGGCEIRILEKNDESMIYQSES